MLGSLIGAGLGGSILDFGTGLLSNIFNSERSYQYSLALQKQNQKWQEKMSNTAHQREVEDLRLAGLNPVLSANGGASYGAASGGSVSGGTGPSSSILSGIGNVLSLQKQMAEIDNINANTKKTNEDTKSVSENTKFQEMKNTEYAANRGYFDPKPYSGTVRSFFDIGKNIGGKMFNGAGQTPKSVFNPNPKSAPEASTSSQVDLLRNMGFGLFNY